jgi:hypothetical protein
MFLSKKRPICEPSKKSKINPKILVLEIIYNGKLAFASNPESSYINISLNDGSCSKTSWPWKSTKRN